MLEGSELYRLIEIMTNLSNMFEVSKLILPTYENNSTRTQDAMKEN